MHEDIVLTPMMKQFLELKAKHPDAVMLFRCGDFYETYSTDAVLASEILGITLTKRANGKGKTIEMAGFPHHALDTYLPKLIRAGKRVAICDQLEDPKLTKKLVKRGITELVTPGVSINDNILNYRENNFLAAVHFGKGACGVAFLDISTGEFLTAEGSFDHIDKLLNNFAPKEVLFERGRRGMFEGNFGSKFFTFELDDWVFTETTAREKLLKHFEVKNLKGFGVEHLKNGIIASGAILQYLIMTQHTQIGHITSLARIEEDKYVRLDKFTVRSLELMGSMNDGGSSLLDVIDKTISPMGARLLKRWMVFPLKDVKPINGRLDVVEYFFRKPEFKGVIEEQLHLIGDLERIISKVAVGRVSPREVVALKVALQAIEPIKEACMDADNASLNHIGGQLDICRSIRDRIEREINNDPPLLVNKGGVIKSGVNAELDELRRIAYSGKDYLLQIQQRESELTGIPSLKIGYNNVFGYYIEVRNVHKDKVPQEWIRKQTLVNAERYITQELKEYEEKILGAESRMLVLEQELFAALLAERLHRPLLDPLGAADGNGGFVDHDAGLAQYPAQLIGYRQHMAQVRRAILLLWRPDGNEDHLGVQRRTAQAGTETQLSAGQVLAQQAVQTGLMNRAMAAPKLRKTCAIALHADHPIAHFGETGRRHQSDIAGANHA